MTTIWLIIIALISFLAGAYFLIRRAAVLAIQQSYDRFAPFWTFRLAVPFLISIGCVVAVVVRAL